MHSTSSAPSEKPVRLRDSQTLRVLFWPAVWLALFLMLFATWRLYWKVQLQNEIAKVRDAGYPASPAEVETWYKKPAGENAADYWMQAHAVWKTDQTLEDWLPSLSAADEGVAAQSYEEPKLGERYPDELLDKARTYFAKNEDAFRWMAKAAQTEECRWPGDFSQGLEVLFPYLGEQRKMAHLLAERMRLQAMGNDWPGFSTSVSHGLALGEDLRQTPIVITALVGAGVDRCMLLAVQSELPFLSADRPQLEKLCVLLETHRRLRADGWKTGFIGERAAFVLDETHLKNALAAGSFGASSVPSRGTLHLWDALGGQDHDCAKICRFYGQLIASFDLPEDRRLAESTRLCSTWNASVQPWEIACKDAMVWAPIFPVHLRSLLAFDAALAALAVERHRRDTGRLPATLNDLVPQYLPAVPADLFDAGKPLKYKAEADRFTVYSIGRNGLDEGGEESTDARPKADDIGFTVLLPHAKRGVAQKRKLETPAE